LTNTKTQSLVFTDTNIDTNYVWATIPIALTGSGDTTGAACITGSCTATSLVTGGSSIVYIYTTALSSYLISFSLILSALTLSL